MKPDTKMVCMVKGAKTLQDQRVDYLAVAVADEGVDLQKRVASRQHHDS